MDKSKQRIIQWNYRGIKPRYEELLLLLSLLGPSVFCLQETFLKTDDNFSFKGFNVYNHIHCDCVRASGGSSILVKSSLPQHEIKLKQIYKLKLFLLLLTKRLLSVLSISRLPSNSSLYDIR